MPSYQPISLPVTLKASESDLVNFRWRTNGISAEFLIPADNAHLLRVEFNQQCIVRLLDEMPLSTEEDDSPAKGLISENFAYVVSGSIFARTQSTAWKMSFSPTAHYCFITGWGCMDVLSSAAPSFKIVPRPSVDEIEAAARVLDREGRHHGWWPNSYPSYDDLDPIGRNEFSAIVERMLMAAANKRTN